MRSQKGYSLIEVLVAILAFGCVASAVAGTFSQLINQQAKIIARNSTLIIAANLKRSLKDESGLLKTLFGSKNSVFDCLRAKNMNPNQPANLSGCKDADGALTELLSSSGDKIIDLKDPTSGFTASGKACTGFGTTNPLCIARAKVDVKFKCNDDACLKPDVVMTISLEVLNDGIDGPVTTLHNIVQTSQAWGAINTRWVDLTHNDTPAPVEVSDDKPFKIVIIVDNSTSMLTKQNKLRNSLAPLFIKLRNLNLDLKVQVLSTTQYLMGQPDTGKYEKPVNSTQQILNLKSVRCVSGSEDHAKYCDDSSILLSGTQIESYELKPGFEATLSPNASDTEFNTFQTSVMDAIIALGIAGSPDEQPLCTLAHMLTQPDSNSFLKNNDKVGFILISDEDDSSTTETCATEIHRDYKPGRTIGLNYTYTPLAKLAVYRMKKEVGTAGYYVKWACSKYKDGQMIPYDATDPNTYKTGYSMVTANAASYGVHGRDTILEKFGIDIDLSCADSPYVYSGSTQSAWMYDDKYTFNLADCSTDVLTAIPNGLINECGYKDANNVQQPGQMIAEKCKIGCHDQMNWSALSVNGPTGYNIAQFDNLTKNYCNDSFALDGPTNLIWQESLSSSFYKTKDSSAALPSDTLYTNVIHYMNTLGFTEYKPSPTSTSCVQQFIGQVPWPSGVGNVYKSVFEPYPGLTAKPIQEAITERAKTMFGTNNYFISAIINPSLTSGITCPLASHESIASAVENLIDQTQRSAVIPICSDDYSPALVALGDFAQTVTDNNSFRVPILLHQGEEIVRVYVNNGVSEYNFEIGGPTGVWPTLIQKYADSTDKLYSLDFSKTGYVPNDTDQVWAMVAAKGNHLTIGQIGENEMTYDQVHSTIRIGYGH